jgi:hypothetical protein
MAPDIPTPALTVAEEAKAAARRFVASGQAEVNPYAGTADEQRWRSSYERWLLALTAPTDVDGGC